MDNCRDMRRTETIIVYSISKDTRVSAERRALWGETSSLTFGYGLRDKLYWRWRHRMVNKASELFPIPGQGSNSSGLTSNCSFIFVYQAGFIKLSSKGQMWCVFLVLLWFFMTLPEQLNNKQCMSKCCSAQAVHSHPGLISHWFWGDVNALSKGLNCVWTLQSAACGSRDGKTEPGTSTMYTSWFWSLLVW